MTKEKTSKLKGKSKSKDYSEQVRTELGPTFEDFAARLDRLPRFPGEPMQGAYASEAVHAFELFLRRRKGSEAANTALDEGEQLALGIVAWIAGRFAHPQCPPDLEQLRGIELALGPPESDAARYALAVHIVEAWGNRYLTAPSTNRATLALGMFSELAERAFTKSPVVALKHLDVCISLMERYGLAHKGQTTHLTAVSLLAELQLATGLLGQGLAMAVPEDGEPGDIAEARIENKRRRARAENAIRKAAKGSHGALKGASVASGSGTE